jgi:hypothetical protein
VFAQFPNLDGSVQTGSAHFAYDGPFTVGLNGQLYTLNITGEQDWSYTGTIIPIFGGPLFTAFGEKSFAIDPSLFASFIGGTSNCAPIGFATGICGNPVMLPPSYPAFLVSSNNLRMTSDDNSSTIHWALTYVFSPVPEPSTWAMMLLGFAAIASAMQRGKRIRQQERMSEGAAELSQDCPFRSSHAV